MSQRAFASLPPNVWYQMMSTRPGSPATIHGMIFMPVISGGFTNAGAVQCSPRSAEAAILIFEPSDQTTYRLPALSIDNTGNTVATLPLPGVGIVKSLTMYCGVALVANVVSAMR